MQEGSTVDGQPVDQKVIFLISAEDADKLKNAGPGTELELEAPAIGVTDEGIIATNLKLI